MHVSLYVNSVERTVDFYNTFFGQPAEKVKPGYAKYHLTDPALIISFVENPERTAKHFGHLGFQVATQTEMQERLNVAREQGIVSKEEIGVACCFATQDKFWVNDPDGHQWEIYYFHADSEFNDPQFENGEADACCSSPVEKESVMLTELGTVSEKTSCEPGSGCC
jgi:catechol 2,3-dioxygenase-like lactoylglutathione lyase family enzyme